MQVLQSNQIIPAVLGRPEHHRVLVPREKIDRLRESLFRNCRTVGIDQAERTKPETEQILRCGREPFAERFAALLEKHKIVGQNSCIGSLSSGWRIHRDALPIFSVGRLPDRRRGIAQKTNV